jgi:hypothetical protein
LAIAFGCFGSIKDTKEMFRMKNLLPIAAVAVLLSGASATRADFELKISSSTGASVTIADGSALDQSQPGGGPPVDGVIVFVGSVGGFTLNVDTGISKPVDGASDNPHMDLSYSATKTTGAAETLTIQLTDTDFTKTPAKLDANIGGTNASGTTTTFRTFFDNTNTVFGTGGGSSPLLSFLLAGGFSGSTSMNVTGVSPYSLTMVVTLTSPAVSGRPGSGKTLSGDAELLNVVPAPSSAILALAGLPVIGLMGWLRRRRMIAPIGSVA